MRSAIRNSGIPTNEISPDLSKYSFEHLHRIFHCAPGLVNTRGYFTFAFVRNPISYYKSYWSYKMRTGWENQFDNAYRADDFPTFVSNVLEGMPGWVSKLYTKFLGPNGDWVDFVGKQETLRDDLISALRLAEEDFYESGIYATDPMNKSSHLKEWSEKCYLSLALKKEIYAKEKEAIELFGYHNEDLEPAICDISAAAASLSRRSGDSSLCEGTVAAAFRHATQSSAETS